MLLLNCVISALCLVVNIHGIKAQGVVCQRGWSRYKNRCYYLNNIAKSWETAQAECRKQEGNLVKIENEEKNTWLKDFSRASGQSWFGANDRIKEGDWRWISDNSTVKFKDWSPGMPDNAHGGEDCGSFFSNWKWNDGRCQAKMRSICEKQACMNITNCITTVCTSLSDITCTECEKILFKLYNSNKECARTCSWDNRWCWPGNCGRNNYAMDCECDSASFATISDENQARCELTKVPEIISCRMEVIDVNNDALMSPVPTDGHCSNQKDFYGNIQVNRITTNTTFDLVVNVSHIPKPEYIADHAFGVTDVEISVVMKQFHGKENIVKNTVLHSDPNSNDPKHLLSFDVSIDNNGQNLINGERLCLRFVSRGGGHLVSKNAINRKMSEIPFPKTITKRDLCYHYDDAHPVHCLENHACTNEPLDTGSRIFTTRSFQVIANGWEDPSPISGKTEYASGIDTFQVSLYEVKEAQPGLLEMGRVPVLATIVADQPTGIGIEIPADLPNPALYAVVLEVKDIANNVKQARRFVMFDNTSKILVRDDKPLYSTTATDITNNKWQTNHGDLCYCWADRYYNDKFYHLNLLQPIKPDYHGHITGIYEQISGILPVSGTENVHGITNFYFSLLRDSNIIFIKETVANFTTQETCLSPTLRDGETYRFDVEAHDVMNHSYIEYVYTHIDSSEPEIFNVGLVKDGYELLNVHNSSDLSKMVLRFYALDIHSGLHTVDWSLGTSFGGSNIGNGSLGIVRLTNNESCAEHSNCYCPSVGFCAYFNFTLKLNSLVYLNTHNGNHNRVYHFTLSVTNEARLTYTVYKEVLMDDSPPAKGVVREGLVGGLDIDYTSKDIIFVHWDGFIDHESEIHSYMVGLARSCLGNDAFSHTIKTGDPGDNETFMIETKYKSARLSLPVEGQYFVTVVAYNNAREPSDPVCSDGILLDKTPPVIVNVTMRSATITESMVCSDETAWYITKNLTSYRVSPDHCLRLCKNTSLNDFITLLPLESSLQSYQPNSCQISDSHGIIYLPHDLIDLHWDIIEVESQIYEVDIGIGSTKESGASPDLIDFHKSPHIYSYKQRHVGLSDGEEIFIFLKTTNSAGLTTLSTIGPVVVDETPPVCPSALPVSIVNSSLYIYWKEGTFYDNEQKEPVTSFVYQVGLQGDYVSAFHQMDVPETADCVQKGMACLTIALSDLHAYDVDSRLTFKIQLHAFNNAGYYCTVNTDIFRLPSRHPPGHGAVFDVTRDVHTNLDSKQDIDVLMQSDEFCIRWEGFESYNDIEFKLGLGMTPGSDDTISFHDIPDTDVYCANAKQLSFYHRYFVTIRAINSGGSTEATSDGFTIVNSSDITASLRVFDGQGCNKTSRTSVELKVGTTNIYMSSEMNLHIGHTYTLVSNTSVTVESKDAIIKTHVEIDMFHFYEFISLNSRPYFLIISDHNHTFDLKLLNCIPDVDSLAISNTVSLYWTKSIYSKYVSHYEVEFQSDGISLKKTRDPLLIAFIRVSGQSIASSFDNIKLAKGRYSFLLRPCVENQCLYPVRTNGFVIIDPVYDSFSVSSTLNRTAPRDCSDIHLSVTDLECPESLSDVTSGYVSLRWGLFRDESARIQITEWNLYILKTNETSMAPSKCLQMPLHPHVQIFTCVEVYCPLGSKGVKCAPLVVTEDPNIFDKIRLYEVNTDANDVIGNKDSFYAANIGDRMTWLHEAELDFTAESVRPGGVILGMGDRLITWHLVRGSGYLNQSCEENPNCVASLQTIGGFSAFQGINLEPEIIYFICAIFEIDEHRLSSFQTCGNGFFIDLNPPAIGDVMITSERGFIIDKTRLTIHWDRFEDFKGYQTLGYPSTIATFSYCIGSEPYGQDLVANTNVGSYKSVKINNPSLRPGEIYYATVTAFDHVGHSATAVSKGVTFDSTGPVPGIVQVGTNTQTTNVFIAEITVHWIGFHDNESGISKTQLGIGSTSSVPDVVGYQEFIGEFAYFSNLTSLRDGHSYYVLVFVTNGAGLSSVSASDAFIIDQSAPAQGVVSDGSLNVDVDFQSNTTHGGCYWSGFSDPHSGIRFYSAGLGTHPLGDDVRPLSFTGTKTDIQWTYNFIPGTTYYCTVQACNGAGLCTSVSSNGFATDCSQPQSGIVHVGFDGHHSRYWAHPNSIQAQWFGFVDVESGIQNYEVCVKHENSSDCDILPYTNVFMSNMMTLPVHLPQHVPLNVEVMAYNRLNMSTKSMSDSFIVDPTPPGLATSPVLGTGNENPNVTVQSDPSLVTLKWKFLDLESPIVKHKISLRTHHDGHTPIENVYLSSETSHIITLDPQNWLRPGDTYLAVVTACNEAGLCTSAHSNGLLVDPTPPHLGGFVEPLSWHTFSSSNRTRSSINMTLYGFKDIESGIKTYYITLGSFYSSSEFSDGVISFLPSASHGESETIQLDLAEQHIQPGLQLILSVWAENNAGLFSDTRKVTVTAIVSNSKDTFGYLEILKHSCDAKYCNKDCTCAVISQKCHSVDVDVDCIENNQTDAYDLKIDIQHGGKYKDLEAVAATTACISSNWTVHVTSGHDIKRIEWSMGQLGMPVGTGIFDPLHENLWYDVGQMTSKTHCLRAEKHLLHDRKYVVYARAWVSTSEYTVFTSSLVHLDNTPPSVRRGKYIVENSNQTCGHDVDFTTTLNTLNACWLGVFTDPQSGIYTYFVALGTIPGGDDIISMKNVGLNTSTSWNDLRLSPGTKYYVTVTSVNQLGLHTTLVSDGVLVDNEFPYTGIVFNTDRFHNAYVQDIRDVGVSFLGFGDRHSGICSYLLALETSYTAFTTENISLKFQNIGLKNSFTFYNISLETGQWFRFAVKARDLAGFESEVVYSAPGLFDSTPPIHVNVTMVSVTEIIISNGTLHWIKPLDDINEPTVYKLHISSGNITSSNVFEVAFENQKQIHPVIVKTEKIYTLAISFISSPFYEGNRSISVLAHGIPVNATLNFTLHISDEVTLTGHTDNVIEVQQISPTILQINTNVLDAESGIRDIYVGVGSSRGGFQFQTLTLVSSPYNILLPVDAPHGQTLHVTMTAVNQGGCRNQFHSGPVKMDHTPPIISDAVMTMNYRKFEGHTLTSIRITWKVIDMESSYTVCSCEIMEHRNARILYRDEVKNECETSYIFIEHGAYIFSRISCLNSANLQQIKTIGPKSVAPIAFEVWMTRIIFDTASETSNGLPVIPPASNLTFSWEVFADSLGIGHYSYRICQSTKRATEWKTTDLRNYATLDQVTLKDDGMYTVEVKACDHDELFCQIANGSFLVSGKSPILTGFQPTIARYSSGLILVWENVFQVQTELLPYYTVTAGTEKGFVDLLRQVKTTKRQMIVNDFFRNDMYVSITCSYVTGLFATFKGNLTLV